MKIVYELRIEDSMYSLLYEASPTSRAIMRWVYPAVAAGCLTAFSFWRASEGLGVVSKALPFWLLTAVAFGVAVRWVERVSRKVELRRGAELVSRRELELSNDLLVARVGPGTSSSPTRDVQRIERCPRHDLIHIADGVIHVIPHRGVISGDVDAFVAAVQTAADPPRNG